MTVAHTLLVLSAWLVATTWKVPGVPGAVYIPAPVIEPPAAPSCAVQVTAWSAPGGLTVAVNCWKAFIATLALDGETLTAAGDDGGGSGG